MMQQNLTQNEALAILRWYEDAGVTDVLTDDVLHYNGAEFVGVSSLLKPVVLKVMSEPIKETPQLPITKIEPLGTAEACLEAKDLASKAKTIAELEKVISNFEGCSLKRTATNLVFADGNPKAKIMLIGEAPGDDEDRIGKPFMGSQGLFLDKMMAAIGLNRENIYISNLINWRPPGNRAPSASEIAICLPFIQRHIELVKPDILLFIGGVSAKALLETNQGITRLRGKWRDYKSDGLEEPIPSMAIFHPAYLQHTPAHKKLAWQDLLMVKSKL